jgi:predicted  nucleic acid-binding Zn ribbon protein
MTDNDTLADYNIKHFGKLSSNQVSCYQYPTSVDSESIASCSDRVCLECGNNHSFRGNIKDAITSIDVLHACFEDGSCSSASKLQEFVN